MKKLQLAITLSISVFLGSIFVIVNHNSITVTGEVWQYEKGKKKKKKSERYDRPDLAVALEVEKTINPTLGYVPDNARLNAFTKTMESISNRNISNAAISGVDWTERGPNNVGGRTRALAFDPSDASNKKVWAGAVGGGLWYNDDITMATSQWQNVDDFWTNIAVTSIAFDPSDNDIMYASTGEGWFNADAIRGEGIWKSSDGGATFTQLSSTDISTFYYVQKVVVASNGDVFATTRNGSVQRSTDGGATWSKVLNSGNIRGADLEIAANGDIYASVGIFSSPSIYRSVDNGDNWTDVSPTITTNGRIELAIAPSASSTTGTTVIYAVKYNSSASGSDDVSWVRKSSDGGSNWSDLTIPSDWQSGNHFTRGQAWYDLIMTVHPTDSDIVLMGGIDLYRTSDGGTNWDAISQWFGGNGEPYVHADQHNIVFRPGFNDEAIFGNDGGIYYSSDAGSATQPNFSAINYGYNVTQFYAVAMENSAGSNYFLAGAQDNGTHQFNFVGVNPTIEVTGGDGGFTFIDQDDSNYQITCFTNNNYNLSTDGGGDFSSLTGSSDDGRFINPADYDSDANILYAAGDANQLERYSGIDGTPAHSSLTLSINSHQVSCVTVSEYTSNRIFIGTGSGAVYIVDNANGTPSLTNISGIVDDESGYVSSIAVGASDNELIATLSSFGVISVFYSSDGGSNWTSKDESAYGLPDFPVRWALFNPNNTTEVLLATEQGIWSTDDITQSNPGWEVVNTGLANVRCDMLQVRSADNLVIVGTHGRGLFSTDIFATATAQFTADKEEWYVGIPLSFQDGSLKATSWEWDFDNDGIVDATAQNPQHTYSSTGTKTVKLTINNDAGTSITKTNYINIINRPAVPFSTGFESDGSGFCSYLINSATVEKWEWGSGAVTKNNFNPGNGHETISGSNNWMTSLANNHGFSTKYALETPPFSLLNGSGQYVVKFDYKAVTGTGAGMNMEYSIDQGSSWQILGDLQASDASAIQNWYNTSDVIGIGGANGWTGSSFSVINAQYDISSFIGESDIRFRLVFGSTGSANDGFQVDNFEITGNATSLDFTWNGAVDSDWATAGNWSSGEVPSSIDNVIIPDVTSINTPIVNEDITINDLKIEANGILTIGSNVIQLDGNFDNDGSMSIASGASFIPMNGVSGTGSTTVERNTTFGISDGQYSVIGSPITTGSTSSLGNIVYSYDETVAYDPGGADGSNRFVSVSTPETMTTGDAYFSANTGDISFTGIPNSGNVDVSLIYNTANDGGATDAGFNLVSNPYTAAISYTNLMAGNTDIDGTIYIWDDGGSNSTQRTNSDYITANSMGAASGGSSRAGSWDGYIRSTQGFFVKATSAGTLNFTPSMMVTTNNSDAGFFREESPTVLKFALSSSKQYNEIIIGFTEDATQGFDRTLDAYKIKGNSGPQLYSKMKGANMAIQALPIITKETIVDLEFDVAEAGVYTLELQDASNYGFRIYLKDKNLNKFIDISETNIYEFETNSVISSDRFSLVFTPYEVLSIDDELHINDMVVFTNANTLNVRVQNELPNATISIYNLSGTLVKQFRNIDFDRSDFSTVFNDHGLFIIRIESGKTVFVKKFLK